VIVGENDAGKSTLLEGIAARVAAPLDHPEAVGMAYPHAIYWS
jgi:ABC-type molybdenum transport system ATPase subunit/photorepair protein PhrA